MNTYRMPRKRVNPRRKRKLPEFLRPIAKSMFFDSRSYVTKGGRVRLFGADMLNLRVEVFNRSRGWCEAKQHHPNCMRNIGWIFGHLAHKQHGARKTDTPAETEWRSMECHLIQQHNPKSCPPKEKVISAHAGTS